MREMTGQEINGLMHIDKYHAIPHSVITWLNSYQLSAAQRLVMERIITFSLMRPTRINKNLHVRLSNTLLAESACLTPRSVINCVKILLSKGLISRLNTTDKGTLYQVHISKEVGNHVKERYQPKPSCSLVEEAPSPIKTKSVDSNNIQAQSAPTDEDEASVLEKHISDIDRELSQLKLSNRFQDLSPMDMLKQKIKPTQEELDNLDREAYLVGERKRLVDRLSSNSLLSKGRSKSSERNNVQAGSKSLPSKDRVNYQGNQPRCVPGKFVKTLATRIKQLGFFKSSKLRSDYTNQVLWAIRFGWYKDTGMKTNHCINHALKLIKEGVWRTPSGYREEQVDWLQNHYGVKG